MFPKGKLVMTINNEQLIYPANEDKCIWMDAGIVGYKLCDRHYECESCPFDHVIHQQHLDHPIARPIVPDSASMGETIPETAMATGEYFEWQLDLFLHPFLYPELPDDRQYYRNHVWAKEDISDYVRLGIDHLAVQMLRRVDGIVLPQTPSHVHRDSPMGWILHHDGAVALRSPMEGSAVSANLAVKESPYLIDHYPYMEGWIVLLYPDRPGESVSRLMSRDDAASFYQKQGEVLREHFLNAYRQTRHNVGETYNDGGVRIKHLPDIIGENTYYEIVHDIFQVM